MLPLEPSLAEQRRLAPLVGKHPHPDAIPVRHPWAPGLRALLRWDRGIDHWTHHVDRLPNYQLVVHIPFSEKHRDKSACWHLSRLLDGIGRFFRNQGEPWLAGWVIERRTPVHAHILLHLPQCPRLRHKFAAWLMKTFKMTPTGLPPMSVLRRKWTGKPVYLAPINDEIAYSGTGRHGLMGLVDYFAKSILRNSVPRCRGLRLGRVVGFSRALLARIGPLL